MDHDTKCPTMEKYRSDFCFQKPVQTLTKAEDRPTDQNPYGIMLMGLFDRAFKRITASVEDEPFMDDVFCYPTDACDYAADRMESLNHPDDQVYRKREDAKATFHKFRKDYLDNTVQDLIRMSRQTLPTDYSQGIEKLLLWVGEKGCGKTTLVNHIFLKNRIKFDQNKIIWVRHSVFFTDPPKNIKELEHKFCEKVLKILSEHYASKLDFDALNTGHSLHRDKHNIVIDSTDDDEIRLGKLHELEKSDPGEYLHRIIKLMKQLGWSFIFILDNIDQYDDDQLAKDTIRFGTKLCNKYGRNLVIMVARIDTVNEHIQSLKDVYQNIERIHYVSLPDLQEVFERRLEFLEKRLTSSTKIRTCSINNKSISIPEGFFARNLTKYFLTSAKHAPDRYLIAELANNNIRDIFEMIKSILRTHLLDVTEIPIQEMFNQFQQFGPNVSEITYNDTLRDHMIIWALLLNNYLYYRNDNNRTWLINLYDVRSADDSYWLKRLILDYFIYMKDNSILKPRTLSYSQLYKVFVNEMNFNEGEFNYSLDIFCARKNTAPLLWLEKHPDRMEYRLTPRGEAFGKYIADLFIYIELIIEDTLLPVHPEGRDSVIVELKPYEPMKIVDIDKRKKLARQYFTLKSRQVSEFMQFLECREKIEKEIHNNFASRSSGFQWSYFPNFSTSITSQISRISNALRIP